MQECWLIWEWLSSWVFESLVGEGVACYVVQAQQLSQKRVTSPPLETIRLTDEEHRLLQSNHQRRLQEIVQKHCTTVIKNLTMYKVRSKGWLC